MYRRSAHHGEASGLAVRVDAVVLRRSLQEHAFRILQWTLGLAGTVVVLWFGAAFLAASPANAAVALPAGAVQQSLQKGGKYRLAANGDGDSDSIRLRLRLG